MAELETGQPATMAEHVASIFDQPNEDEEKKPLTTAGSQEAEVEEEVEEEHEPTAEEVEAQEQDQQVFISLQDRIARGRLREIDRLRERDRERVQMIARQNERMANLEKELAELRGTVAPEYDKELVASDPTLSYFTKRLDSIKEQLDTATAPPQRPEGYIAPEEMQQAGAYAAESRREFVAHTPDWNQAYGWLRNHYANRYGLPPGEDREQVLNVQEVMAVRHWMEMGQDPASEIYARAVEEGWRPGMAAPRARNNGTVPETPRIRRVKEVIGSPSLSGMRGEKASSGRMSAKEFYSRYNHAQRQQIYQDSKVGNEIHEQLDSGSVDRHLLPNGGR